MPWVGLQRVNVLFSDHTHYFFILVHSFKIQQKSGIWVIMHSYEIEYKSYGILTSKGGILTSTVCSVVAGHVVIASYT